MSRFDLTPPRYGALVFDTETDGLPQGGAQPRLVQLGFVVLGSDGRRRGAYTAIVQPEGFVIGEDATRVHGISQERALREGLPLHEVMSAFVGAMTVCDVLVAHHLGFDLNVLLGELRRLGRRPGLYRLRKVCTLRAGTPVCGLQGNGRPKPPTLDELHRHLFGVGVADAHDALADAEATARCYRALTWPNCGIPHDWGGATALC